MIFIFPERTPKTKPRKGGKKKTRCFHWLPLFINTEGPTQVLWLEDATVEWEATPKIGFTYVCEWHPIRVVERYSTFPRFGGEK